MVCCKQALARPMFVVISFQHNGPQILFGFFQEKLILVGEHFKEGCGGSGKVSKG